MMMMMMMCDVFENSTSVICLNLIIWWSFRLLAIIRPFFLMDGQRVKEIFQIWFCFLNFFSKIFHFFHSKIGIVFQWPPLLNIQKTFHFFLVVLVLVIGFFPCLIKTKNLDLKFPKQKNFLEQFFFGGWRKISNNNNNH